MQLRNGVDQKIIKYLKNSSSKEMFLPKIQNPDPLQIGFM